MIHKAVRKFRWVLLGTLIACAIALPGVAGTTQAGGPVCDDIDGIFAPGNYTSLVSPNNVGYWMPYTGNVTPDPLTGSLVLFPRNPASAIILTQNTGFMQLTMRNAGGGPIAVGFYNEANVLIAGDWVPAGGYVTLSHTLPSLRYVLLWHPASEPMIRQFCFQP